MPLPLVGAHAVLDGMPEFNKNADIMNQKVGALHTKMSGLGGVAQRAGSLVGSAFRTMAEVGAGAAAGIAAVGGGILKLGYDAANLPGIESVFKNMTAAMSVDADALMTKMRAASYGAVKDFDLMKQANKAMVGAGQEFGKQFAETLPTLMKVSREAAKAQGLSVEYMYDSIVTGIKRMSPLILDNLGFQISLGEAQDKYAASIGKTSAELSKEEKQIALLNEVARLGNQLIEESGGHIDSVQKDVIAWGTALKNVKDRIGIELVPVLQKFMDVVGKPSQGMQDAIVGVARSMVQKLIPAIDNVTMAISTFVNGPIGLLAKGIASIGTSGLADMGKVLMGALTGANVNFGGFGSMLSTALMPALGKDLAWQVGGQAMKILQALQTNLEPARKWVKDLADDISLTMRTLLPDFGLIFKGLKIALTSGDMGPMLLMIKKLFRDAFGEDTAKILFNLAEVIGRQFMGIVNVVGKVVNLITANWDTLMTIFGKVSTFIQEHSDLIIQAIQGIGAFLAGKALVGQITTFVGIVGKLFGGLGGGIVGLLSPINLLMAAVGLLFVAWQNDWLGIREVAAKAWDFIKPILDTIGKVIEAVVSQWGTWGDFPWEDILPPGLVSIAYDVANALEGVWEVITQIGDVINSVFSSGLFSGATLLSLADIFGLDASADILNTLSGIYDAFMLTFSNISMLVTSVFNTILAVAQAVWPYVQVIISVVAQAISDVLNTIITVVLPALVTGFNAILTWVNSNWPAIQAVIVTVFTVIAQIISAVISTIIPWVVSVFQGLVDWVVANWPLIQATIQAVMQFIGDFIAAVLNNIQEFWAAHGEQVLSIITTAWEFIKGTVENAIKLVQGIISLVMAIIRGDWSKVWESIKVIISTVWDEIKLIIDTALKLIQDIISVAWGLVKLSFQNVWDAIALIIHNTWESIKREIKEAIDSVLKTITDQLDAIKKVWDSIWGGLAGAVRAAWNSILGLVCSGVSKALGLINSLINAANKIPGVDIPNVGFSCGGDLALAAGGILNRPTFVAGEAGAEVVAPLQDLLQMIRSSLMSAMTDLTYQSSIPYSGPQPNNTYNYGGDTYVREYNLTTQSVVRPGTLAMEFSAMELAHA